MLTGAEKARYIKRLKALHQKQEEKSVREWARILGLPHVSVWRYIQKGLTIEEIAEIRGVKYPPEK